MQPYASRAGRRPLALALAALAALSACADQPNPAEPQGPPTADGGAARQDLGSGLGNPTHWADGYLTADDPTQASYPVSPFTSFNRAARFGGAITITRPAGTTGRYVATFPSLSSYLGGRSTVHVSGYSGDFNAAEDTYCKPVGAYLVRDQVEVRCFKVSTGLPTNARFKLLVTRNYSDLAFAYAHRETSTNYAPSSQGSWNPAGTSSVVRSGVGQYRVTFNNLAALLAPGVGGHVQVNAVGTSNAHCSTSTWYTNGTPNLSVDVRCFATPTGAPVDRRFTVLFVLPARHLAYAWADNPSVASYSPLAYYSSNPTNGPITITRSGVGSYKVDWAYLGSELFEGGNAQVTAYGGNTLCKITSYSTTGAYVQCFAPNGTPADSRFSVLRGS
jgi:hypothetical protein